MAARAAGSVKALSPRGDEIDLARESSAAMADFAQRETQPLALRLENRHTGRRLEATVPASAARALAQILGEMAKGNGVALVPLQGELSTQRAADLLGVSRPYFVKLLEEGRIPFRKVGSQRRVKYHSLLRYMEQYQRDAAAALEEMTAEAQRLGLYE